MRIRGACHCGNIRYWLEWPESDPDIPVRVCGCTFCRKHGGEWTSHRSAELSAELDDSSHVSTYRFGTGTAEFYVCSQCGVVPFVVSVIDAEAYAVVNVNTFEGIDLRALVRSPTSFDDEGKTERLGRRKRNWIPRVRISRAGA